MTESAPRLRFEMSVDEGRGSLLLRPSTLFGWIQVERLELEIPDICFPLDITGGISQFQHHTCRVIGARFTVDRAALAALVAGRAPLLEGAGFEDVSLSLREGELAIGGTVVVGGAGTPFTARVHLEARGGELHVALGGVRVYGLLRRPAPVVAHDLLCLLLGASIGNAGGAGGIPRVEASGLARARLRPLEQLLWRALPPAGWRLPEARATRVTELEVSPARGVLAYGVGDEAAAPEVHALSPRATRALRAAEALAAVDDVLLAGDTARALTLYRAELGAQPGGGAEPVAELVTERLLSILPGWPAGLHDAEALAREALARAPDFAPARLALAAIALSRGARRQAAEAYLVVLDQADAAGEEEDVVRAALAAARCLADTEPTRASALYERVLELRPAQAEAARALAAAYGAEGRWPELVRFARRRAAALTDPTAKAAEHARAGQVLLERLDDPALARTELEAALAVDGQCLGSWELLARATRALGDREATSRALERVAELRREAGDATGEGAALAALAAYCVEGDELARAEVAYARALALRPDDPEIVERAAELALRTERRGDALVGYERLAALLSPGDERREQALEILLRLLTLEPEDAERAHACLERLEGAPDPGALVTLARHDEAAGRLADALELLAWAAELLPPADGAALHLERARLLETVGDAATARAVLRHAIAIAPGAPSATEAARRLAAAARQQGDAEAEGRWLDELLDRGEAAPERAPAAVRRAELHLAAGDPARARRRLDEALAAGADPAATCRLSADVLGALGDHAGRGRVLAAAAARSDDAAARAALLVEACRAVLAGGDGVAALALADEAATFAPGDAAVRAALGDAAVRAGAWARVEALYAPGLDAASGADLVERALRLGQAREHAGRDADALALYARAIEAPAAAGPALAEAWRRLAELRERQSDLAGAARAWVEAAADPRSGERPAARADLRRQAARILHRRLGDPVRAREQLEEALRLDPTHVASLDGLEQLDLEAGDLERVTATLRRKIDAVSEPGPRLALLLRLGEVETDLGHEDAARAAWSRALELEPGCRRALRALAEDARRRGELATARAHYTRLAAAAGAPEDAPEGVPGAPGAPERSEDLVDAELALAALARTEGHLEDAAAHLRTAAGCAPPERARLVLEALEALYGELGRDADRAEVLGRLAALEPEGASRRALRVRQVELLRDGGGRGAAALRAARDLFAEAADDRAVLRLLADTAGAAGEVGEQVDALLRLARVDPDRLGRGLLVLEAADLCRAQLGQAERARALYELLLGAREVLVDETGVEGAPGVGTLSGLGLSPEDLLELVRRVPSPAQARRLARVVAKRFSTASGRAGVHLAAAARAREGCDLEGEEEALAAARGEGAVPAADLDRLGEVLETLGRGWEAAEVLCEALQAHASELRDRRRPLDDPGRARVVRLVEAARASGNLGALEAGLQTAASLEPEPERRARWLAELERARHPQPDVPLLAELLPAPATGDEERRAVLDAIEALAARLGRTPPGDVRAIVAQRLQLAELRLQLADLAGAEHELLVVLVHEPANLRAIERLAGAQAASGQLERAVETLGRLAALTDASPRRAEILYLLGELRRTRLGDEEGAADAYLKAADLDSSHAPTLERLVAYYWRVGDDSALLDAAADLDRAGGLAAATPEVLARVGVCAGLAGDAARAGRASLTLGSRGAQAVASALAEALARPSGTMEAVVRVAQALTVPPGPTLREVRAALQYRGRRDPRAQLLAATLARHLVEPGGPRAAG